MVFCLIIKQDQMSITTFIHVVKNIYRDVRAPLQKSEKVRNAWKYVLFECIKI